MAVIGSQQQGFSPLGLVRNFGRDLGEIGLGFIAAVPMIGDAALKDVRDLPGGALGMLQGRRPESELGGIVRGAVEGFKEETPIIPFFKGAGHLAGAPLPGLSLAQGRDYMGEAGTKFYEHPATSILDAAALGAGTAGLANRARFAVGRRESIFGVPMSEVSRRHHLTKAGFLPMGRFEDLAVEGPTTGIKRVDIQPDEKYRYGRDGVTVGDQVYARPTHRRIGAPYYWGKLGQEETSFVGKPGFDVQKFIRESDELLGTDIRKDFINAADHADNLADVNYNVFRRRSNNEYLAKLNDWVWEKRRHVPQFKGSDYFSTANAINREFRKMTQKFGSTEFNRVAAPYASLVNNWYKDTKADLKHIQDPKLAKELSDIAFIYANDGLSNVDTMINYLRNSENMFPVQAARLQDEIDNISMKQRQLTNEMDLDTGVSKMQTANALARRKQKLKQELDAVENTMNQIRKGDRRSLGRADFLARMLTENRDTMNKLMNSDYTERMLDGMEVMGRRLERVAYHNYSGSLSEGDLARNRFRTAEAYDPNFDWRVFDDDFDASQLDPRSVAAIEQFRRPRYDEAGNVVGKRMPIFRPRTPGKSAAFEKHQTSFNDHQMDMLGLKQKEPGLGTPMSVEMWQQATLDPKTYFVKALEENVNMRVNQAREEISDGAMWATPAAVEDIKKRYPKSIAVVKDINQDINTPLVAIPWGDGVGKKMSDMYSTITEVADEFYAMGDQKLAGALTSIASDMMGRNGMGVGRQSNAQLKRHMNNIQNKQKMMILPAQTYKNMTYHFGSDVGYLFGMIKLMEDFNKVWKPLVLHFRPKWHVYNAIGSFTLLGMRQGFGKAIQDIWKSNKGVLLKDSIEEVLDISNIDEITTPAQFNKVLNDTFGDVLSYGSTAMFETAIDPFKGSGTSWWSRAVRKSQEINTKVGDNPFRRARIYRLVMNRVDKMRRAASEQGIDHSKYNKFQLAKELIEDPKIRQEIAEEALHDMIDFTDLSPNERYIVTTMMPFWAWVKGATKAFTAGYLTEHPLRTTQWRYAEKEAMDRVEEEYGDLPTYMKGLIPLPRNNRLINALFGDVDAIGTSGAAPQQTATQALGMLLGGAIGFPTGSETPVRLMTPLIGGGFAMASNQHPFYGSRLPEGQSGFKTMMQATAPPMVGLGQKMIESALGIEPPLSPRATTERPLRSRIAGYTLFGTPYKVRPGAARLRGREEAKQFNPRPQEEGFGGRLLDRIGIG